MDTPLWHFTTHVASDRAVRMLAITSFADVVNALVKGVIHRPQGQFRINPPLGYRRFAAILNIGCENYDAFFNSPVGYRAQYCLGVENGVKQNRLLLDALTPPCVSALSASPDPDLPLHLAQASLNGFDAKVWIKDSDLPESDDIHIEYPPWVAKAKAALNGTSTDRAARANAAVGVLAPLNVRLEIKGAWVSSSGEEWRDPEKANRAQEIRDYGYT